MKKIIMANWKMQLTIKDSLALANQFAKKIRNSKNEVVICPDYSALTQVGPVIRKAKLSLGAQDCAAYIKGAQTGEVSPLNLKSLGVQYVIIGHSERREHLHENSIIINNKIKTALESKLIPVLCVGEKLAERMAGVAKKYIVQELRRALKGVKIKNANNLLIAYEPVWAISTNKHAKPLSSDEANEIQAFIKAEVKKIVKKEVRVLYGGSSNATNAADFLSQENISGLLVGGASLKLSEFAAMVN